MKSRLAPRLAWALLGLSVLLCSVAIWLAVTQDGDLSFTILVTLLAAIPFPLIGAMIASRFPSNAIGWIFCAVGLFQALNVFSAEYVRYALITAPASLPFVRAVAVVGFVSWMPSLALLTTFLLLLFPDGRLPSRRWRWAAWVSGTGIALVLVGSGGGALLVPARALFSEGDVTFPPWSLVLLAAGASIVLMGAIASVTSLVMRYRRSRGETRQQLKWMAFAGVLAFIIIAVQFLPAALPSYLEWMMGVALLAVPMAAGLAILKYRLYDIDVVINKTVVYGILAAFVTVIYVGIVVGIGTLVGSRGNAFLTILATAIIALLFQPARIWARHFANRLVYGKRATPYEVLSRLAHGMGSQYSADGALPSLARVLAEGTGAARAEVWLRVGKELRRAAAWPEEQHAGPHPIVLAGTGLPPVPGAERALPVTHEGELLGALAISMPRSEVVTSATDKLLTDVASQTGLVLRNVRLIEELRASRQRLVTTQDEERRRLERDIHDGAQQQLVALAVKLRLVEATALKDPNKATDLAAQARTEAQEALDALRDLARGIYPPLLADQGLAAALEAQARKIPVSVRVEPDGVGRYPQETEAAAYFCVLEALQNVTKYAEASSVTVRLRSGDGVLGFEVHDDGRGFDPASTPRGSGLQNMADRLEALGGSLQVESTPGRGTVVIGRIPIRIGAATG
jgi:signal transduction histidine kinase